ncbi:glycoside hydrolase family 32 protein [Lachnospiraceae bacterium 38-10]
MISQALREAREFEEESEKQIQETERPSFHLTARTGWMNDPNGFSCYKGQYHLFYQYNPYDTCWGAMHWGHAVSRDMLHWEYLPAALAPDELYDKDGCFSGSAIELPDGRHLLMYTGVVREKQENGGICEVQTQCLAVGDGTDYEKYENNPVLDERDIPEGSSRFDFRDPKVWRKKDGTYRALIGSRPADGSGQVLLYASEDGLRWQYRKVLAANNDRFGKMWECPDFFELDGKGVLIVSPQDMLPRELEYHNGNGTVCLIGQYDEETDTFTEQYDQAVDYGIDFYAPQTVLTPDGRRVLIGWMQNWETCAVRTPEDKWFGQMSLPRELSVRDGRLYQNPIRELEERRRDRVEYREVLVRDAISLEGIRGRRADIELAVRPADEQRLYRKFAVRFAQNAQYQTSVSFRPLEGILKIDRTFSGSRKAVVHQRRSRINRKNGHLKLRIILDRFSVEVFINDGEQVMSATIQTVPEADGISFFADGEVKMDIVKYALE